MKFLAWNNGLGLCQWCLSLLLQNSVISVMAKWCWSLSWQNGVVYVMVKGVGLYHGKIVFICITIKGFELCYGKQVVVCIMAKWSCSILSIMVYGLFQCKQDLFYVVTPNFGIFHSNVDHLSFNVCAYTSFVWLSQGVAMLEFVIYKVIVKNCSQVIISYSYFHHVHYFLFNDFTVLTLPNSFWYRLSHSVHFISHMYTILYLFVIPFYFHQSYYSFAYYTGFVSCQLV